MIRPHPGARWVVSQFSGGPGGPPAPPPLPTWRVRPGSGNTNHPIPGGPDMSIVVASRRTRPATLVERWPGAAVLDVTSKGPEPWLRFSPFYPHGGIPIPSTPDETAASVEGLWQGLKLFEREDIDPAKWRVTTLRGIKRAGRSRGAVRGHRFGVGSAVLLGYRDARYRIYLPAYRWVLETCLTAEVEQLRALSTDRTVVLLDYETNADVDDLSAPLSHAALVKRFLDGDWPGPAGVEDGPPD